MPFLVQMLLILCPFQSLQLLVRSLGVAVTAIARDLVDVRLGAPITKARCRMPLLIWLKASA